MLVIIIILILFIGISYVAAESSIPITTNQSYSFVKETESINKNATNIISNIQFKQFLPQIPILNKPNLVLNDEFNNASFVQAGIGLRNVGSGTISIHTPYKASILKAYLYWTVIDTKPSNEIFLNGQKIFGELIAADKSCWNPLDKIFIFRSDVTENLLARSGLIDDQYISIH